MTRVLVVGNGGREHAICRALATSNPSPQIFAAPGNPGTAECASNLPVRADDIPALVEVADQQQIDLVIPGPEAPLVAGLSDRLTDKKIACCGPSAAAASLEASKAFTRRLAARAGLAGPTFSVVDDVNELATIVQDWHGVPVVKADGLAAGKGVFLPDTKRECLEVATALLQGRLGDAGRTIVLESRMVGTEASLFYACHGENFIPLPHAKDHKRLSDADRGPNTGGMGAVSPNPIITDELEGRVANTIVAPILKTMVAEGAPFVGFLFAGIMITNDGPRLLEFNVRLGDPEAQAILPRLADGEFLRLCNAVSSPNLSDFHLTVDDRATCAIVLAAAGYPEDKPSTGAAIAVDRALETKNRWLVHAGTVHQAGQLQASGGRVATIVGRGPTADVARSTAYQGIGLVHFRGAQHRTDIGA